MNIHIVPDDKFIDTFIDIAVQVGAPGNDVFYVRSERPYKYIKSTNVVEAPLHSEVLKEVLVNAEKSDFIYFHYMSPELCEIANLLDIKASTIWLFWGAEFFEVAGVDFGIYEPHTKKYVQENTVRPKLSRLFVLHQYRKWKRERAHQKLVKEKHRTFAQMVAKLSYIMHYSELDYDLIVKHFPTKAKFHYFTYPPPYTFSEIDELILPIALPIKISPTDLNIWLGNSGYPNNNHLDAIILFAKLKLDHLKLWVPLSYGDPKYTDYVQQKGKELLGERFESLTNYMSFEQFMNVIHAMDVAVMPHRRAQAFGNIQLLLYFGKKIFMSESTLYRFLLKRGYHVYSTDSISVEELNTPLEALKQKHNKDLIVAEFSKEVSTEHIKQCLHLPAPIS